MSFMNYLHSKVFDWESVTSFIIRSVLSERRLRLPPRHLYQKVSVLIWSWTMLVVISAYKGNLLAIITKPSMNIPFLNMESMVEQTQMKWGYNSGVLFRRYAKSKPPGTTLRQIYDKAMTVSTHPYCHSVLKKLGNNAAICDISGARAVIAYDFSKTGTCNYYLTEDKILAIDSALAFPVSIEECCNYLLKFNIVLQKQSPYVDGINSLIYIAKQMGLILRSYYKHLPNATKCNSISEVFQSHEEKNVKVKVELNDIYGMLVILGIGAGVALLTFITEIVLIQLVQAKGNKCGNGY